MLNRILIIANYDGTLRLKGNPPQPSILKNFFNKFFTDHEELKFKKHDYLISVSTFLGINSAD